MMQYLFDSKGKVLKLSGLLLKAGRVEDLKRAVDDKEFCRKLYEEFHIL